MIDVSMTATLRTTVHREVLDSLERHLKTNHDLRLILNVDPKGEPTDSQKAVVRQFRESSLFCDVKTRTPGNSDFFKALTWTGSTVSTPYVLQGEDDWVLHRDLNLDNLLSLSTLMNLDIIGLFCKKKNAQGQTRYQKKINGEIIDFIYTKKPSPSFTPSILTLNYLIPMSNLMRETHKNWQRPIQFVMREPKVKKLLNSLNTAKYLCPDFNKNRNRSLLSDIGKKWKKKTNIKIK